jgi:hypothetical protein
MHLRTIAKSGHGNDPPEEKHFLRDGHMVQRLPEPIFVKQFRQTTHSFGNTPLYLTPEFAFQRVLLVHP